MRRQATVDTDRIGQALYPINSSFEIQHEERKEDIIGSAVGETRRNSNGQLQLSEKMEKFTVTSSRWVTAIFSTFLIRKSRVQSLNLRNFPIVNRECHSLSISVLAHPV
jgi:hypothetical protein